MNYIAERVLVSVKHVEKYELECDEGFKRDQFAGPFGVAFFRGPPQFG